LVLIVEDNDANIDLLDRRLRKRGFETVLARDGREALELAAAARPAIVLMDLEMPVMSGLEAIVALRADPALAATPALALTAHATPDMRDRCARAGFDGFVTKPIDLGALLDAVAAHLAGP
jgi:CheY-like chemotaxis protein